MCKRKQEKFSQQNRVSPERKGRGQIFFMSKSKDYYEVERCKVLQVAIIVYKKFQKSKQNYIP
jgi:hypothetical protein